MTRGRSRSYETRRPLDGGCLAGKLKAAVFNAHLDTWGGGERSTYAMANRLAAHGLDVEVVTFAAAVPDAKAIEDFFGPGHDGFKLRSLRPAPNQQDAALTAYLADKAVFVNHSAGSAFVNPCPLGIYAVMFPFQDAGAFVGSYQHFVCNSEYTQRHTLARWGSSLRTHVIYPAAEEFTAAPGPRDNDIVTIGRFNWIGHTKNQEMMVQAFDAILDLLPKGSRLVLLGRLNDLPHNREPFAALKQACRRLPVIFEVNVSEERKREVLRRASLFWHGTGLGRNEAAQPDQMEHFGIAIVEAMRAGLVPLCYYAGGPREIVQHGVSGYLYRDAKELEAYTLALVSRTSMREQMRAAAIQRAAHFTRARFDERFDEFLRSVVIA